MRSKLFKIATSASVALWASVALAAQPVDTVISWLQDQGFTHFEIEKTWLGRTKIEAKAAGAEREIIINTKTGEILRDYWEVEDANLAERFLAFINPFATVVDSSGDTQMWFEYHDDDDEEDEVDEDERDNSGSGSFDDDEEDVVDNSGSGSFDDGEEDGVDNSGSGTAEDQPDEADEVDEEDEPDEVDNSGSGSSDEPDEPDETDD